MYTALVSHVGTDGQLPPLELDEELELDELVEELELEVLELDEDELEELEDDEELEDEELSHWPFKVQACCHAQPVPGA